jgi:hypothetical protein
MNGPLTGPDPQLQQLITPQGPVPAPNMPQPPQQQGMDPSPPGTLGAVNQQMAPGNPITEQYVQAIGSTLDMLQQRGFLQPMVPPQPGPNLLESLGTFGIANLVHHANEATRKEENYRRMQRNQIVGMKGVDLATKMVDTQAQAAALGGRMGLQLQGLNLRQQQFINTLMEQQHTNARNQLKDEFQQNTIPAPLTADQIDAATQLGYHPSTRFKGRWTLDDESGAGAGGGGGGVGVSPVLKRDPSGGWVDPNTPVGKALTTVGGGATDPKAQRPGESTPDFLRRKKRQAQGLPAQAQKDVSSIDESIAAAREITQLANDREVQSWMGPMRGRAAQKLYETGGSALGVNLPPKVSRYLQKVAFLQAQAVGPLLHGSRNPQVWKQIQQHLPKPGDTVDLTRDKLSGLTELYTQNRDILLTDADLTRGSATTETPTTGGGPPSTLSGTPSTQPTGATGVTPNGVRYRVVQ